MTIQYIHSTLCKFCQTKYVFWNPELKTYVCGASGDDFRTKHYCKERVSLNDIVKKLDRIELILTEIRDKC